MPRNSWVRSGSVHHQKEPLFRANHKIPQRPENNASVLLSFPLGCHSGCGDSLPEWSEVPLSWSPPFLCINLPLGLQLHPAVFIGSSLSSQETLTPCHLEQSPLHWCLRLEGPLITRRGWGGTKKMKGEEALSCHILSVWKRWENSPTIPLL